MKFRVLAINPGSTSTKIAVYEDEKNLFVETLRHKAEELAAFDGIIDQYEFRKNLVLNAMEKHNIETHTLNAVVGRGGLIKPVAGGTYRINEKMLADLKDPTRWGRIHASNLGAFIAKSIADDLKIPSYIVDPVTVDEFPEIARVSGVPEIERKSLSHALNIRYTAFKLAEKLGKELSECNMIAVQWAAEFPLPPSETGKWSM